LTEYVKTREETKSGGQKSRKRAIRKQKQLEAQYPDLVSYIGIKHRMAELDEMYKVAKEEYNAAANYLYSEVSKLCDILEEHGFVQNTPLRLTTKGQMAVMLVETNCLAMTDIVTEFDYFTEDTDMDVAEIVALFSCFTNIRVSNNAAQVYESRLKTHMDLNTTFGSPVMKKLKTKIHEQINKYHDVELYHELSTGLNYEVQYDIMEEVYDWCRASTEDECKRILGNINNKGVFTGEFVKALLKINNIAKEVGNAARMIERVDLENKMSRVEAATMKYIACNQSLYVL
jgi:hypothetical protein